MTYETASIKTFLEQIKSGKTSSDAAKIAEVMQNSGTLNTREISRRTGIKESTVTARIDALREMGIMRAVKDRKMSDGVFVTVWAFVSDPAEQQQVSREYRREKFVRRLRGLLDPKYIEFTSPYLRNFVQREVESLGV